MSSNLDGRLQVTLERQRERLRRAAAIIALTLLSVLVLPVARMQAAPASRTDRSEGVSIILRPDRTQWAINETPSLRFQLQNAGQHEFRVVQSQESGRLEVDGVWYDWRLPGSRLSYLHSPFPPGRQYGGLPIQLTSEWRAPGMRPLQLTPGRHTLRFEVTIQDPNALGSKSAPKPNAIKSEIAATSNPVEIEIISAAATPKLEATQWGTPASGVAVQLRSEHFAWTRDSANLLASITNEGPHNLTVAQAQQLNELEVDGVWYRWAGDGDGKSSSFPPGRQSTDIPITLVTNWQTAEGRPLRVGAARYTVRFAMTALSPDSAVTPIRAVSNPVQIEVATGIGWIAAAVEKHLPGYAVRSVRRQTGNQESMVDVLLTPSGEEIDLTAASREWSGRVSYLPPFHSGNADRLADLPTYRRNPNLTSLAPSLNLKIETAQDALDVARLLLGLFRGGISVSKAEPSENGWVVTRESVITSMQVQYEGPVELILEDGVLKDVRQEAMGANRTGWVIKDANPTEPGWGEPVGGLSVRLQSDKVVWYLANDAPALRLSVRNLGDEALAVPESQELGELEVDGVWHKWSDKYFVAHKTLAPGQQVENLAVFASSPTWRKDSTPLFAGAGKHTIRFAVIARRGSSKSDPTTRAVSNAVEVEFRLGVAPKATAAQPTNSPPSDP